MAFDYLVDPANRAQWQSSLARVEDVVGEVGRGPALGRRHPPGAASGDADHRRYERPHRWAEIGTWRAVRATLELTFSRDRRGLRRHLRLPDQRAGAAAPARALLLSLGSTFPVRADLRRAAPLCEGPLAQRREAALGRLGPSTNVTEATA